MCAKHRLWIHHDYRRPICTAEQDASFNLWSSFVYSVRFPYCVADAFYYFCVPLSFLSAHWLQVLLFYISIVIGNFIGCNLYRMVMNEHTGMQKQ